MKKVEVTLTYKQIHMLMAGVGGLMKVLGRPPENVLGVIQQAVNFLGPKPGYISERADEVHTLAFSKEEVDMGVSAAAIMYSFVKSEMLNNCPHSLDDVQELGEMLSKAMLDNWPELAAAKIEQALKKAMGFQSDDASPDKPKIDPDNLRGD